MVFDYEQSVWGQKEATLKFSDPTAFRLRQSGRIWMGLPAGARILEVGCGGGRYIRAIKKYRPDLECFGCDISVSALEQAEKFGGGIKYMASDVKKLPYNDNEFDVVLVFDVLEHALDVSALLVEISRVLKPKSFFYSYIPCEGDWLSWWRYLGVFSFFNGLTKKYAGHINCWSRQEWKNIFSSAGFSLRTACYSEHLVGQALNVASFLAMNHFAKKHANKQVNNEYFFSNFGKSAGSGVVKFLKFIINSAVYFESWLCQFFPSPNWHGFWVNKN